MTACPSCGASAADDAARCPLCGTDLTGLNPDRADAEPSITAVRSIGPTACPICGHFNPADAHFCNACGATLHATARAVRPAAPPRRVRPDVADESAAPSSAARQALILVGVAVAAVVALFLLRSRGNEPADPTPALPPVAGATGASGATAVPDGPPPPLADSLQQAADGLEAQNTAQSWFEAGRYYLTAGFDAQQAGDASGVLWIRRAVADFDTSLALEENPDVRFALAEASQFDPANPMRPVLELRTLLAEAPGHVGGNFLMGQRRMMIGRLDSARVSFERVVALAPDGDPLRDRARELLAQLDEAGASTRGVPDGQNAPPPAGTPAAPALPPAP